CRFARYVRAPTHLLRSCVEQRATTAVAAFAWQTPMDDLIVAAGASRRPRLCAQLARRSCNKENLMRRQARYFLGVALAFASVSGTLVWSQDRGGPSQVVAVRAGRLFDAVAGTMLSNQIVLIRGDRIAELGPSVQIPQGARVIDLGGATVLPGMIDGHVHTNGPTPNESVEHQTMVM